MHSPTLATFATQLAVSFIPMLLGIILHEVAHGAAASRCGDPTARMLGRLTLNPLPHIDPAGLAVFAATAAFSPIVFGWAKPVPINPRMFRSPRRDMILVAAAGPAMNLLLAMTSIMLLRLLLMLPDGILTGNPAAKFLVMMLIAGIRVNVGLAWFNLIPIPPLDGSRILACILPRSAAMLLGRFERTGLILVVILLAAGGLDLILTPLINGTIGLMQFAVGL